MCSGFSEGTACVVLPGVSDEVTTVSSSGARLAAPCTGESGVRLRGLWVGVGLNGWRRVRGVPGVEPELAKRCEDSRMGRGPHRESGERTLHRAGVAGRSYGRTPQVMRGKTRGFSSIHAASLRQPHPPVGRLRTSRQSPLCLLSPRAARPLPTNPDVLAGSLDRSTFLL